MEIERKSYHQRKKKQQSCFCLTRCFSCCFKEDRASTSTRRFSLEALQDKTTDKQLSVLYEKKSNRLIDAAQESSDAGIIENISACRVDSLKSQKNLESDGENKVLTQEEKKELVKSILQKYLESKQAVSLYREKKEESSGREVIIELEGSELSSAKGDEACSFRTFTIGELEQGRNFKVANVSNCNREHPHNFKIHEKVLTSPRKSRNVTLEFCKTSKVEEAGSKENMQSLIIEQNEVNSPRKTFTIEVQKTLATKVVKPLRKTVETEHLKYSKIEVKENLHAKNPLLEDKFGEPDISQASIYFPAKSKSVPFTGDASGNFDKDFFCIKSEESKSESCVAYSANKSKSRKKLEVTLTRSFMGESSILCDNVDSSSSFQSKLSCEVEPLQLFSDDSLPTGSSASSGVAEGGSSTSLKWKLIIAPHKGQNFNNKNYRS